MFFSRRCKITFICHGATIYSENGRFSDVENYPQLSESGHEEMEKVCDYLRRRGTKVDAIYTSDSPRAIQSAKKICKLYKKDFALAEDLKPRKCGKLNGLTFEQIEEKHPDLLEKWFNSAEYDDDLEAESINDFIRHTKKTIDEIVENNKGNRVIIVTYPEVIQAAICAALDIPADKIGKIFIRTGSATQISYYQKWASLVYSGCIPLG